MDALVVAYIQEYVSNNVLRRLNEIDARIATLEYESTISGRNEIASLRADLDDIRSDAVSARDAAEAAAADAITAADAAEDAAEDATDATDDDDDESSDDDESAESTKPELEPPEADVKVPDRRSWYERPVFGANR